LYSISPLTCVCLSFQTQEAHFTALRITFFRYACRTSPINDNSSPCFGFNQVSGLSIWLFWSQILKFWIFLRYLEFFENRKSQTTSGFFWLFQSERLGSGKTLSELHIHYKSLLTRVYYHAGCKEYCKDFSVTLKMFNLFNKKQISDRVITRKGNASED